MLHVNVEHYFSREDRKYYHLLWRFCFHNVLSTWLKKGFFENDWLIKKTTKTTPAHGTSSSKSEVKVTKPNRNSLAYQCFPAPNCLFFFIIDLSDFFVFGSPMPGVLRYSNESCSKNKQNQNQFARISFPRLACEIYPAIKWWRVLIRH